MPSIRKRNNSYQITVSCGEDIHHKQILERTTYKPKAKTPAAIKKEVEKFALEFEERVKNGRYLDGEKITYSDFVQKWHDDWAVSHLTPAQVEQYLSSLEHHVLPDIGNMTIARIPSLKCQDLIKHMENDGYSPESIRRVFTAMKSVFAYAYRMNIIEVNPCNRCELPRLTKEDDSLHCFNLDQTQRFLDDALHQEYTYKVSAKAKQRKNRVTGELELVSGYSYDAKTTIPTQFQAFFYLAIFGGFRKSELLALTWHDVNFDEHSISIHAAATQTKECGAFIKGTKTAAGKRCIVLPSVCFDLLKEWYSEEKEQSEKLGTAWKGGRGDSFNDSFVFIQADGQIMHISTPYHKFKEIIALYNATVPEDQKLPEITLHQLRHTCASLLLSEGVDIATISKRLGHSKPSVTLDVYSHALETKDQAAASKLEEIFSEKAKDVPATVTVTLSTEQKAFLDAFDRLSESRKRMVMDIINESENSVIGTDVQKDALIKRS